MCLAELGFPVLRFDYYGTGNSTGDPHGPEQVTQWRASIRTAVQELRYRSGCDATAIIGLRLGATLADLVATESAVDALVLWDPCVTGASYVREVKMLATTSGELSGAPVVNEESGDVEALGFALTPEMVRDLTSIDLTQITGCPAPNVLLLHRAGNSGQSRLAAHMRATGAQVTEHPYTDHDTFMVAAIRSRIPRATMQVVQQWLVAAYPTTAPAPSHASRPSEFPARLHVDTAIPFHEDVVLFNDNLFGVVTEPESDVSVQRAKAAVIFLNTGADHHIGPRRMYVQLARKLVQRGFTTLRFDLAGLGDSALGPGKEDNVSYPEGANSDIGAAIGYLAEIRGVRRVVLIGMCSGGYHAVYLACKHPEVAGMISINPALYWKKGDPIDIEYFEQMAQPRQLARAARSSAHWQRLLRGELSLTRVARKIVRNVIATLGSAMKIFRHGQSPDDKFAALLPPRIDTHFIFAGNDLGLLYLRSDLKKFLAVLQARPNFTLSVIEGAGHVFIPLHGQAQLNDTIMTWLLGRYGESPRRGPNGANQDQSRLERTRTDI
jgi:pimeloyl-ACP methyl ester carboxylesterase